MADKEIKEGDQASWQWSGSRPGGKVAEVKEHGELAIESKNGNTIKKNADPENPAVHIERSGNDVVKRASELQVEKPGDKHKEAAGEEKTVGEGEKNNGTEKKGEDDSASKTNGKKDDEGKKGEDENADKDEQEEGEKENGNGNASAGEKRKAADAADEKDEANDSKKRKTNDAEPQENGSQAPKKKGRPPKNGDSTPKKDAKKKEPKKAATESGEPRRSSRHASKSE